MTYVLPTNPWPGMPPSCPRHGCAQHYCNCRPKCFGFNKSEFERGDFDLELEVPPRPMLPEDIGIER